MGLAMTPAQRWVLLRRLMMVCLVVGAAATLRAQERLALADNDDQAIAPADGSSANSPTTAPSTQPSKNPNLPMVLYNNGVAKSPYIASGWMGNIGSIAMDPNCKDNPHSGTACLKVQYKADDNYGGVVWQNPINNWGDQVGGFNLTGAKRLTFWARGDAGDEKVDFKYGIIGADKSCSDSSSDELNVSLTKEWKQYSIDLSGKDLKRIVTPFCWVVEGQGVPVTFYLDDVRYE